jgi:methionyl aminopeptidase
MTRYCAPYMSRQQMDDIQKLFDGDAWQRMPIKSSADVAKMRAAGAIGAHVLNEVSRHIEPGVTLRDIDRLTHDLIVDKYGAEIVRLAVQTSSR